MASVPVAGRYYRIGCCRTAPSNAWEPETEWGDRIVYAAGIAEAFDAVKALGWWPTHVIDSAWTESALR